MGHRSRTSGHALLKVGVAINSESRMCSARFHFRHFLAAQPGSRARRAGPWKTSEGEEGDSSHACGNEAGGTGYCQGHDVAGGSK